MYFDLTLQEAVTAATNEIFLTELEYKNYLESRPILVGKKSNIKFPSFEKFKSVKEKMEGKANDELKKIALELLCSNSDDVHEFHCILISFPLNIITKAFSELCASASKDNVIELEKSFNDLGIMVRNKNNNRNAIIIKA
nr:6519_t:CDS:2 [Entrophospora candida]